MPEMKLQVCDLTELHILDNTVRRECVVTNNQVSDRF